MLSIGYDIDNVLAETLDLSLELVNRAYGTNYRKSDCTHQTLEESFGLSTAEVKRLFDEAVGMGDLLRISPISNAVQSVNNCYFMLDQYFITARDIRMRSDTISWFDMNGFLYLPERVLFERNTPEKKADSAKELGLRLFVEDNVFNANAVAESGIPVLLVDFDYPFNRDVKCHSLVNIVRSWEEIDNRIKCLLL